MRLGVLHQTRDLVLGEAARCGDGDVLLASGGLVARLDVDDAVRIDIERHLDLRDAPWCGRDPVEDEPRETLVVRGELALALGDVDLHLRLRVRRGREDL